MLVADSVPFISALLSKFFGVENANAARALIQGTDALEDFTTAVTGTSSATDQAAIVMDSYAERQARVNQKTALIAGNSADPACPAAAITFIMRAISSLAAVGSSRLTPYWFIAVVSNCQK